MPEDAWSKRVYENGWDAKQLLCHLASGGAVEMLLAFARDPSAFDEAGFDIDKTNAQEVAARQDKPVSELLSEIRDNCKREIAAIEAAPDDQLAKRITVPGMEGPLAEVILWAHSSHCEEHLRDLRSAVR